MSNPLINDQIRQILRKTFTTVWTLETLLFLQGKESQSWSIDSLVKELRSSALAITDSVTRLQAIGLVVETEPKCFQYRPANSELDDIAKALKQLYALHPYTLIEEIAAAQTAGIQSFADAFKFRKD